VGTWREDTLEWGVRYAVVDFVSLLLVGFATCHVCNEGQFLSGSVVAGEMARGLLFAFAKLGM
jgi:hypothetical protein